MYRWTDDIANLRVICLRKRRKYSRAGRRGDALIEHSEYKVAKQNMKKAIEHSKAEKFEELRRDINNNPWGLGYKLVLNKLC